MLRYPALTTVPGTTVIGRREERRREGRRSGREIELLLVVGSVRFVMIVAQFGGGSGGLSPGEAPARERERVGVEGGMDGA